MDYYVGDKSFNPAMDFNDRLDDVEQEHQDMVRTAVALEKKRVSETLTKLFGKTMVWRNLTTDKPYKRKDGTSAMGKRNRDFYCCLKCNDWFEDLGRHFNSKKGEDCGGDVEKAEGLMSVMKHVTKYVSKFQKDGTVPTYCSTCKKCVENIR